MKTYRLKFKIPQSRYNIDLGNGINVNDGDELLVIESLGKNILLNYHRFIVDRELIETRSLSNGYYSIIKKQVKDSTPSMGMIPDRTVMARRKQIAIG